MDLDGTFTLHQDDTHFDQFKLKMPVLGPLVEMIVVNRFSKSLGILLKGGVPLLQSLLIVKEAVGNAVISKSIGEIQCSIKEGEKIATPLRASGVFPDLFVHMVACGEETGNLEDMLNKVADTYETRIRNSLRGLIALFRAMSNIIYGYNSSFYCCSHSVTYFCNE